MCLHLFLEAVPTFPTIVSVPYCIVHTTELNVFIQRPAHAPSHILTLSCHVYSQRVYTYKLSVNLSVLGLWPRWRGVLPWLVSQQYTPNGLLPSGRGTVVLLREVLYLLALRRDRGLALYRGHAVPLRCRGGKLHDPIGSPAVHSHACVESCSCQGHKSCSRVDAFHACRMVGHTSSSGALSGLSECESLNPLLATFVANHV